MAKAEPTRSGSGRGWIGWRLSVCTSMSCGGEWSKRRCSWLRDDGVFELEKLEDVWIVMDPEVSCCVRIRERDFWERDGLVGFKLG